MHQYFIELFWKPITHILILSTMVKDVILAGIVALIRFKQVIAPCVHTGLLGCTQDQPSALAEIPKQIEPLEVSHIL